MSVRIRAGALASVEGMADGKTEVYAVRHRTDKRAILQRLIQRIRKGGQASRSSVVRKTPKRSIG